MPISIRVLEQNDIAVCDAINRSLPEWFGIEEGLAEAREFLEHHAGFVATIAGHDVGYLTYTRNFSESAEISWMAVSRAVHRQGVGRALVSALEFALCESGCTLLSVKTLADSHPSEEYAQTRAFYRSMGFLPEMILPDLWGPANPCLVMVKSISYR